MKQKPTTELSQSRIATISILTSLLLHFSIPCSNSRSKSIEFPDEDIDKN